jgi:hypothetical protein
VQAKSDSIFDSPHELRVRWRGHGGKMSGSSFTVYREHAAERELKASAVAPGPDGVGEGRGLRAALHADTGKCIGHEPFTEPGIHWPQQQVGVRSPHEI